MTLCNDKIMKIVIGILLALIVALAWIEVSSRRCSGRTMETRTTTDLLGVCNACILFRDEYGKFPTGSVANIIRSLKGANEHNLVFYEANVQDDGEPLHQSGITFSLFPKAYLLGKLTTLCSSLIIPRN